MDAFTRTESGLLHPRGAGGEPAARTGAFTRTESGLLHSADVDLVVAELAARQHDHFARWQLVPLGIGDDAIRQRLGALRWRRVHRGVYRLGAAQVSPRGRWMADVLACGEGSRLGGTSVLELLDIRRQSSRRTVVITTRRGRREPQGIDLRTSSVEEVRTWDGIPISPLHIALVEAARHLDDEQLEAAYENALVKWRLPADIIPRRNARLNKLIKDHQLGRALTDSDLENRFRSILKQAGLPQPESNPSLWTGERVYRPDFLWRPQRLVVEIDGDVHEGRRNADDGRAAELAALGFTVQRYQRLQLIRHPQQIVDALRPFL